MEDTRTFAPLLIVIVLAFIVPILLTRVRRMRLPIVVGEILVGIVVGRSGFGWVAHHDPVLDLLAEIGFVFLMFLAGMEIDFNSLGINQRKLEDQKNSFWGPIQLSLINFFLTLVLAGLASTILFAFGLVENVFLMALILSTTSLGVVMPVLKERGLIRGRFGQTLLVSALIADFATMLLITIDVAVLSRGLTFDILLIGLLFLAMFLIYHFGKLFFNRIPAVRQLIEELSHATAQIKVRAAFAMMLTFVVLSEVLGTEVILGAFLAGVIVSLLRTPDDANLTHQLESIGYGFFIPIFFIMVGVDFNVDTLLESPQALLLVPMILIAAVVVKMVPAMVYRVKYSWRETLAAGTLLSARLSLIIAAAEIGLQLHVITEAVDMAIILVAMITVSVSPVLFVRQMPRTSLDKELFLVVVGAGELGIQVARELLAHRESVIVLDDNEFNVERARTFGIDAHLLPVECDDRCLSPYLDNARALICSYEDTEKNLNICSLARLSFGLERVISVVSDPTAESTFEQVGIIPVTMGLIRARFITLLARSPATYNLLTRTDDNKEILEVVVQNPSVTGIALKDLKLPGDILLLTIRRDGESLIPHGNTRLNQGDEVTLFGSDDFTDIAKGILLG